ncbi:MAG: DNA polymerase II, partial [Acidobacteriota bacterium]
YALDHVAREILGEGKTISGSGRAQEIMRLYREDRPRLVEYNRRDAWLARRILQQLHLVELALERSRLTGVPPDRVSASIASFDRLYLTRLAERKIVAPSVGDATGDEPAGGGHVLEPQPGLYDRVLVLDFKSLYPSIIRTFQIDPLGYVSEPLVGDDVIRAPNGACFRRQPGLLPSILDELFPRRLAAQQVGDRITSQAIKILMNSFYGVLATPACRFYNPRVANAITSFGRELLLWTKQQLESDGYRVLYGDTDSLFVLSDAADSVSARRLGTRLATKLTGSLAEHVHETWRVESKLELEFERLYVRLLLPEARRSHAGARKRYAGLIEDARGRRVVFTGLEIVRRDWTELAKRVQRELYERLFANQPVEDYLRGTIVELRGGRLDELLVYRKVLRKPLDAYTSTTPPHVAAARKLRAPPGRRIAYVWTVEGPEPASQREHAIDHEHYVQKQVRPVAEPVLAVLGLDFDEITGKQRQARLF